MDKHISVADKFIMFNIIACVLLAVRFDMPFFYNFAIGFSLGASLSYGFSIYGEYRNILKDNK